MAIELGDGILRLKADTGDLNKALGGLGSMLDRIVKVGAAAAVAGVTAVGTALLKATMDYGNFGDAMDEASQRTGMTVETLSKLKYAADQSGTSIEGVETASKFAAKFLGEMGKEGAKAGAAAAKGSAEARDKLADLAGKVRLAYNEFVGLQRSGHATRAELVTQAGKVQILRDQYNSLAGKVQVASKTLSLQPPILAELKLKLSDLDKMNPDQLFMALATAVAAVENPTRRTVLAVEVFGRSGTAILPMLANGAKGLKDMMAEVERLGITISGKDLPAIREFDSLMAQFKGSIQGVWTEIGRAFLPVLNELIKYILPLIFQFRQWILTTVLTDARIKTLTETLKGYIDKLKELLPYSLEFIKNHLNMAITLSKLVGGAWLAYTALKILETAMALVAANPLAATIIVIVAAIGVLISAIVDLVQHWEGVKHDAIILAETVKTAMLAAFGAVDDFFRGLWDRITGFLSGPWSAFRSAITGAFIHSWFPEALRTAAFATNFYMGQINQSLAQAAGNLNFMGQRVVALGGVTSSVFTGLTETGLLPTYMPMPSWAITGPNVGANAANIGGLGVTVTGNTFNVRNDADIELVATKLYDKITTEAGRKGIRL